MKKTLFTLILLTGIFTVVGLTSSKVNAQNENDTIRDQVSTLNDKVSGIEERITTAENDLYKLTKIKISGYIQAQWEWFQDPSAYPANTFSLRRARVKIQYEPVTGVAFVLQPDFVPSGVTLKDAYAQVNEPWLKTFSLWAGQFNRPNYEVEYSSSQREVPERSRVIRALYPGERAMGAKLEVAPPKVPLKFQLMVLNGNDAVVIRDPQGNDINVRNKDFDNFKDLMGRLTYQLRLGNYGSLDVGAHGYYGFTKATTTEVLNSEYELDRTVNVGESLNRRWLGFEAQLYLDFLGGMAIKGEYIFGQNALPGYDGKSTVASPVTSMLQNDTLTMTYLTTTTNTIRPNIEKSFSGYYIYLVKNIGKKNQLALRYDYYDPNSKLDGNQIGQTKYDNSSSASTTESSSTSGTPAIIVNNTTKTETKATYKSSADDIAYGTLTAAWNYYFSDNIRFQIAYELPMNEKVAVDPKTDMGYVTKDYTVNGRKGTLDYSNAVNQGIFTVRLQVKF